MSATIFEDVPLHWQLDPMRPAVRPVSRVAFEVSDKAAFDECIRLSLNWMEETPRFSGVPRSGVPLPPEARTGQTFDITDVLGANPAKAVRIDARDGALWAARLDWPDPQYPRNWVSEFFAERRAGQLSRFGAQLTCVVRGECPEFDITCPNVVAQILQTLSAEADGRQLTIGVERTEPRDISDLVELLYEPSRRLPIVAISETESGVSHISPDVLARRIAGAAHVVCLSADASWELTRAVGKRMSVFNGAVRLYLPGLTEENQDPYQHPLYQHPPRSYPDGYSFDLLGTIAALVLPAAFLNALGQSDFPRYAYLREIVTKRLLARQPAADPNEQLREAANLLRLELKTAKEERDIWETFARDEQNRRLTESAEVERLKAEVARQEAKNKSLEYHLSNRQSTTQAVDIPPLRLTSYENLETWAEYVLNDHVYIHDMALKDCKKNGNRKMLERIESALLVIRDYLVPYHMQGGLDTRTEADTKLAELGMSDSPCFVDREDAKRTPGYTVQYEGEKRYLYDHIKYGNGYDNANQIRIYYFWDDRGKRFVIGKMPSHLPNSLTN
jgi:hypothetical protein